MAMAVRDGTGEVVCHSESVAVCSVAVGTSFSLIVDAFNVPDAGYELVLTYTDFGTFNKTASEDGAGPGTCNDGTDNGNDSERDRFDEDCVTVALVYEASTVPADELIWPDSGLALRILDGPGLLDIGGTTGVVAPLLKSTFAGHILDLTFRCSPEASSTLVQQLPNGHPLTFTTGAMFINSAASPQRVIPDLSALTIQCVDALPDPGDSDGDQCTDIREAGDDAMLGGERNFLNPHDFYDVNGDQNVDLANDILGVVQHYSPTGTEPSYDVNFDRGPSTGPNAWNMTAPDGVIDLPNDILGVVQQYLHDCS
jgi:hypothetical protein